MVPTSWQDEALARNGVSREVPCSALKGETVPDSLPAIPKSPPMLPKDMDHYLSLLSLHNALETEKSQRDEGRVGVGQD